VSRVILDEDKTRALFVLRRLSVHVSLGAFHCVIPEYRQYLVDEAMKAQTELVAVTWLLCDRSHGDVIAYMSLINDAIKLSATEKEIHHLDYPFKTIPAMKIAKLAVSTAFAEKYRGIGSRMIDLATGIAEDTNEKHSACRFLTVDADIEHDEGVTDFYVKNSFVPNAETNRKSSKTISMRKDIYRYVFVATPV
jgi:hypothetical protein